jgi:superfamily II DNA/RNA helicase
VRPSPDAGGFAALGIRADLDEALAASGVRSPFPIQAAAIPDALSGRDVLGRGQTGSGKTLAFGLPTLTRLADGPRPRSGRPRALVLLPTRELAVQVCDALTPLARSVRLRTLVVAGGLSYGPQLRSLDAGVDVLVATPGRLRDLLERGAVVLDEIEVTVLDEADHMADLGFLPDVTDILDRVPAGGQRLLFSATLDKGVDRVVERYLTDPVTHSTDAPTAAVSTMAHHVLLVDPADKKRVTAEVANRAGRTIVFVRTKLGADRVAGQLRESGVLAAALHGGLTQSVRSRVLDAFRDGRLPVLVATDVAARGIHVDDVSLVLQADPPGDHKDYLHRSGRTARAGEHGIVATLALPHQRRSVERMTRTVDVDVTPVRVRPGRGELLTVGGREPTGEGVSDAALRAVVDRPRRSRAGRPRRPRQSERGGRTSRAQ